MFANKSDERMANRCAGHCEIEMDNFDRNSHLENDEYSAAMLGTEDPNYVFNPEEIPIAKESKPGHIAC